MRSVPCVAVCFVCVFEIALLNTRVVSSACAAATSDSQYKVDQQCRPLRSRGSKSKSGGKTPHDRLRGRPDRDRGDIVEIGEVVGSLTIGAASVSAWGKSLASDDHWLHHLDSETPHLETRRWPVCWATLQAAQRGDGAEQKIQHAFRSGKDSRDGIPDWNAFIGCPLRKFIVPS